MHKLLSLSFIAVMALVIIPGCEGDDGGISETGTEVEMCELDPYDSFDLDKVFIDGDSIRIDVSYSGGCEEHFFKLCWNEIFMESDPVQTNLELIHEGNKDGCEAYVSESLSFDLTPMKEEWQQAYDSDSGTMIIHLKGRNVSYDF